MMLLPDRMPFDVRELVTITEALQRAAFTEEQIALVMGGNPVRLLHARLPETDRLGRP
jgi:microsomal dipeptidase-like Zn-dependent dipeptidase